MKKSTLFIPIDVNQNLPKEQYKFYHTIHDGNLARSNMLQERGFINNTSSKDVTHWLKEKKAYVFDDVEAFEEFIQKYITYRGYKMDQTEKKLLQGLVDYIKL